MNRNIAFAVIGFAASACAPAATTPPQPAVPAVTLAYAAPAPVTVSYEFTDSSVFNIQGGAVGDIRAATRSNGTASGTYAANGSNVELRMRITDLTGSFTNSAMGGGSNVTEADVTGEAVLVITPRGAVSIQQMPTASRAAQQMGMSSAFFRRFVVRLPSSQVRAGSSWVDTLTVSEDAATSGMRSSVTDIVTSTWARDTTVAGRMLNVITHSTQRRLEVAGNSEGVEIVQKLSGTATGYTLWDAQRNLVAERFETTSLSGTFDLPAMGLTGLPVTAQGAGKITLR